METNFELLDCLALSADINFLENIWAIISGNV